MVSARVLVSDAETPAAVAVVRSLGRAGHRVTALAATRPAAAAASRHCRGAVRVPCSEADPAGWSARLAHLLERPRFDVFLPVTDTAILLAARVRDAFHASVRCGFPTAGDPGPLLDKPAVLDRAAALGIPVLPRREGDALPDAPLPAVLKPGRSRTISGDRVRSATARVLGRASDLAAAADRLRAAGFDAYAEPWIPGEGRGVFLLLADGEALARFAHRRIRESGPLGGPSAVCESDAADPALEAAAVALARDLGVSGPFMAEFRGRGEDAVLLEVNARYWGSLGLAIDAGVDFPRLHVAALLGIRARGPVAWRAGLRRRNLAFDMRHAALVLRGPPAGLDVPWPGRLGAVVRVLGEKARGLVHSRYDPAPGRAHLIGLLGKAFKGAEGNG
jgi:predicted ATP-grasp superfamily ATP-dependent carboligase